jgi:biopolymer transport protein TolR
MGMDVGAPETGKRKKNRPEMNVTPLVDVVLVLLIIFMVVTPALYKQFWIHLPDKPEDERAEPPPPSDAPLVVSVDAEGNIRINRDVVTEAELTRRLPRMLAARGDRKIFFDAADDADFGRAARALDLARGGGAATIAVMTEPLRR